MAAAISPKLPKIFARSDFAEFRLSGGGHAGATKYAKS
jgi:hypothetical protein